MLGTTIGNYRITALLGEGGMGKVYVAQHPTLARKSAIKVLHADQARDPVALSRFFTEAKAADAIRHPSIVEIYDYGTLPDGAPYIVMEYLEGETVAERLQRGALPMGEALDIVCQAASALGAAHDKDVLHRDLKPDNLFLVTDGAAPGGRILKVVDFGIAKLQNDLTGTSHRTRTGALIGTPLYMSPEQCLGERNVGPPSDLYSLAAVAYELLCGRPPFEAEAVGALINMHVNEPVLSPRKLNPRLPRALENLLLKALSKAAESRQASMQQLLAELEPVRAFVARSPELASAVPDRRPSRPLEAVTAVAPSTITGGARMPQTVPPRGKNRSWLLGALAAVAVTVTLLALVERGPRELGGPAGVRTPLAVPELPLPPAPLAAPAAAPVAAPVVIQLESEPAGATVSADGKIVGKTPATWTTAPSAASVALVFTLDGHRREVVHAVLSAGMKVRTSMQPLLRGKKRDPSPGTPVPDHDIKSER